MKRNALTLSWIILMVLVVIVIWVSQTQVNPIQVQSQDEDINWADLEFVLKDKDKEVSYVAFMEQDGKFTHLINDYNSSQSLMQSVYDEVYSAFPLTNRPNLREYGVVNPNSSIQLWYQSSYLRDQDDGSLIFDYKIVDKDASVFTEGRYDLGEGKDSNYSVISYAEDDTNYYLLLTIDGIERNPTHTIQLTINKETSEVVNEETIEEDLTDYYALSNAGYQLDQPHFHLILKSFVNPDSLSVNHSQLSSYNNYEVAVIDPITLEVNDIVVSNSESTDDEEFYGETNLVMVRENHLYYLKIDTAYTEGVEDSSSLITMYEYDFDGEDFEELWNREFLDFKGIAYTLQNSQLYMSMIEDEKQVRVEHVDILSGETDGEKIYTIKGSSQYQFLSTNFVNRQY